MTREKSLVLRAALGICVAAAGYISVSLSRFRATTPKMFDRYAAMIFAVSRALIYILVFGLLHMQARGDVVKYYATEAEAWLGGGLPYQNFPSSYAPLHAFMDSLVLRVWHSSLALIALSIVADVVAFTFAIRLMRQFLPDSTVKTACLLYIFSPVDIQFVTIDGQNNVLIAMTLLVALFALSRSRTLLSGLYVGLSLVFVKFLAILYPAFFLAAMSTMKARAKWIAGGLLVVVPVYGAFALKHINLLLPLEFEGNERSACDLPWLVEVFTRHDFSSTVWNALTGAALLAVTLALMTAIYRAPEQARIGMAFFSISVVTLTLMFFSKKSWPNYTALMVAPICALFTGRKGLNLKILLFQIYNVVAVTVHSIWASTFHQEYSFQFRERIAKPNAGVLGFLLLSVGLLVGYVWLGVRTGFAIRGLSNTESSATL